MAIAKKRVSYLRTMLRPILSYCMRNSLHFQEIITEVKLVLVECCIRELERSGEKVNITRVSLSTGVNRRDVSEILQSGSPSYLPANFLARVLTAWETAPGFQTSGGKPRALTIEKDGKNSFTELVHSVGRELKPGAILAELKRIGYVRVRGGKAALERAAYTDEDIGVGLRTLALDSVDLLEAVEENWVEKPEVPNLHCRTEYDNISKAAVPEIREWLLTEGSRFHKRAREYLSQFDKDINPEMRGEAGTRIVLGSFSREDPEGPLE